MLTCLESTYEHFLKNIDTRKFVSGYESYLLMYSQKPEEKKKIHQKIKINL